MKNTDYRLVRLSESIEIPVPVNCTVEQEQALIAEFLKKNDLAKLEEECRELEKEIREGTMLPLEEHLHKFGIIADTHKRRTA